ncbi:MAG: putative addiction module antidote protein [Alloalcanivorax venustensis]
METEKFMSRRQPQASISHDEAIIEELRADREFAIAYLQAALEELDDADNRAAGLLALRDIAEAYGGMAVVARDAGITREALYRALSPTGNPTLKTLLAVLHAMDMRLSVTTGRTQGLTPPQGNTCRPA